MYRNWFRALFMWPGVRVRLVNRDAVIRERLRHWNVRVQLSNGESDIWWRGNLRLRLFSGVLL